MYLSNFFYIFWQRKSWFLIYKSRDFSSYFSIYCVRKKKVCVKISDVCFNSTFLNVPKKMHLGFFPANVQVFVRLGSFDNRKCQNRSINFAFQQATPLSSIRQYFIKTHMLEKENRILVKFIFLICWQNLSASPLTDFQI